MLVQTLMEYEDAFASRKGYHEFLALGLSLLPGHGALAAKTAARALKASEKAREAEFRRRKAAGEENDSREFRIAVEDPLAWQTHLLIAGIGEGAGYEGAEYLRARQMEHCPDAYSCADNGIAYVGRSVIHGLYPRDLWFGLCQSGIQEALTKIAVKIGEADARAGGVRKMMPFEVAGYDAPVAFLVRRLPEGRFEDEVQAILVAGTSYRGATAGRRSAKGDATFAFLPLFCVRRKPNIVGSVWFYRVHDGGFCADAIITLDSRVTLAATMPYYLPDRDDIVRGMPMRGYLNGVAMEGFRVEAPGHASASRKAEAAKRRGLAAFRSAATPHMAFRPIASENGPQSICAISGKVKSVRNARFSGGDDILCLTVTLGDEFPMPLPVYAGRGMFKDGKLPRKGDIVAGRIWMCVDFFDAAEGWTRKSWEAAHPLGAGDPPDPDSESPITEFWDVKEDKYYDRMLEQLPEGERDKRVTFMSLEEFDAHENTARYFRRLVGEGGFVMWNPNPHKITLAARVGGKLRNYHVAKVVGDVAPQVSLADDVELLVVRLIADGKRFLVRYEGFPPLGG